MLSSAAAAVLGILCTSVHDSVKVSLTGVVAVPGIDDAKHIVSSCLLITIPVLVNESGSTASLPQFWEHFSLQETHKSTKTYFEHKKNQMTLVKKINL